jgi:hypothetical protein
MGYPGHAGRSHSGEQMGQAEQHVYDLTVAEDWEDELSEEDLLIDQLTGDDFGVPSNIMGSHPERFFSMLGRIVSLAATLENKTLGFYQDLVGSTQEEHIELPISKLIGNSLKELRRLPQADAELAREWLLEAGAITRRRNDYVHSLWPAQAGGKLFGWRTRRRKDGGSVEIVKLTHDDMQADLSRIVALLEVKRLHRFLGLVSSGQHLQR